MQDEIKKAANTLNNYMPDNAIEGGDTIPKVRAARPVHTGAAFCHGRTEEGGEGKGGHTLVRNWISFLSSLRPLLLPPNLIPASMLPPPLSLFTQELLWGCTGIAFLTVVKGGFFFSGTLGTGCVVGRLRNGRWSAPSAICMANVGWGFQVRSLPAPCRISNFQSLPARPGWCWC